MQTIILAGSVVAAITAIAVFLVKIFKFVHRITEWVETKDKHDKENYLDIKRLVITSPYMPLSERIKAGDEYIKRGGNGEVKHLYESLIEKLD